jgi:hypothetical protein
LVLTLLQKHLGDHLNSGFFLTGLTTGTAYFLGLAIEASPLWHLLGLVVTGGFTLLGQWLQARRERKRREAERDDLLRENTNLAQEIVKLRQKYGD